MLIGSFRVNHKYSLPASLRPTHIQQTVPHECAIDGVIFPSVRDAMILHRGEWRNARSQRRMLKSQTNSIWSKRYMAVYLR